MNNYYTYTRYYDNYYDSLLQVRGCDSMEGTGYKSYLRFKGFMDHRVGPDGDMNAHRENLDAYYSGQRSLPEIDVSNWNFLGPVGLPDSKTGSINNMYVNGEGWIHDIVVNPDNTDEIYIGSHNGGLWKTEDGGDNWFSLTDEYPEILGIKSIAINSFPGQTIYILTDNTLSRYSYGVFKSTNGGTTWTSMNNGLIDLNNNPLFPGHNNWAEPRKLIVHPSNDQVLYLLLQSYIFKSTNGGQNWSRSFYSQYNTWEGELGLYDISIDPANDNILYASGHVLLKSTDAGENWTEITDEITDFVTYPEVLRIDRCEITYNDNYPGKHWFYYTYYHDNGQIDEYRHRIVKFTNTPAPAYSVVMDKMLPYDFVNPNKMEIEVSNYSETTFYIGGIAQYKLFYNSSLGDYELLPLHGPAIPQSSSHWLHVDIRDIQLLDNGAQDIMYVGCDGGISVGYEEVPGEFWNWDYLSDDGTNGLQITEFYGFGDAGTEPYYFLGGTQDLAGFMYENDAWHHILNGDCSDAIVDDSDGQNKYLYVLMPCCYNGTVFRSNDNGESWVSMFDPFFPFAKFTPAMAIHPNNPNKLLVAADKLYRFNEARTQTGNPEELLELDEYKELTDIEISEVSPSTMYVSTVRAYGFYPYGNVLPQDYDSAFWKTTNGGSTWSDISSNLPGLYYGNISDVETDPNDINRLWVAFGKATKPPINNPDYTKKVYVSDNGGAVNSFEPYAQGLPDGVPVNVIRYDHKYNRLFCGTDAGVFMRDLNLQNNEWEEFNTNLPHKIVTDLEINYTVNKIRASTYGRGLWESDLYCYYDPEPLTISGNPVWEADAIKTQDIVIPSGCTLTIQNCNIFFPDNARIVVQRGGKLIVDNARLSNSCDGKLWRGIEVWGNPSYEHYITGYQDYHGIVELNNATIENAFRGVTATRTDEYGVVDGYYGGIIEAESSTFRNNKRAIEFSSYEFDNRSYFLLCDFITDDILIDNGQFECFMLLHEVQDIEIIGCTFKNTRPYADVSNYFERGHGIYCMAADFIATDHTFGQHCYFSDLNYGIKAYGYSTNKTFKVEKAIFSGNKTGVYTGGINGAIVTQNTFSIGLNLPNVDYCGIYLDYCNDFKVEENTITGPSITTDPTYGIVVNNSGEKNNDIYNNDLNYLQTGISAQYVNRDRDGIVGLTVKCNDFYQTYYDIFVSGQEGGENHGIKYYQGYYGGPNTPAGNIFSRYNVDQGEYKIENAAGVYYFHHEDNPEYLRPDYISGILVGRNNTHIPFSPESCKSQIEIYDIDSLKNSINTFHDSITYYETEVDLLQDGGNTDQKLMDISTSQPPDAVDLNDDLMADSPYLSDTVMIESIEKEDVLLPVMVKDILVANPHSAKSPRVMQALDERQDPLPDYMIWEIEQGLDTIGELEILRSNLSNFLHQKSLAEREILSIFKNDTTNTYTNDSIVDFLNNCSDLHSKFMLAFTYLEDGDTANMLAVVDGIPDEFELSDRQYQEYIDYQDYFDIMMKMIIDSLSIFEIDSIDKETLRDLANDSPFYPGAYARNILMFIGEYSYQEPYCVPTISMKNEEVAYQSNRKHLKNELFKIYPNPVIHDFFLVEHGQNLAKDNLIIEIHDIQGKKCYSKLISNNCSYTIIKTDNYTKGIYIVAIKHNNKMLFSRKITIF